MVVLLTTLASTNAYSNSAFPRSNCSRRKDAFWTSVKSAMWTARSGGRCARCRVWRPAILGLEMMYSGGGFAKSFKAERGVR